MLENLDNPEQLGHMIVAAFVGTLWGPLLPANTTYLPFAARVKRHPSSECAHIELVLERLMSKAGVDPRLVGEGLRRLLPAQPLERQGGGMSRPLHGRSCQRHGNVLATDYWRCSVSSSGRTPSPTTPWAACSGSPVPVAIRCRPSSR